MGDDGELHAVRELLRRILASVNAFLDELEGLKSIADPTERGEALLRLLERRIPQLRLVTKADGGESDRGRGGKSSKTNGGHDPRW
jgi:hypothetical protein